jgi:hypothetical protein
MKLRFLPLTLLVGLTGCLSPLHKAAGEGNVGEIRKLISAGADPNVVNDRADRYTPLLAAVENGQTASVLALLEAGADPLFVTSWGTARQNALKLGRSEIARILKDAEDRKLGISPPYEGGHYGLGNSITGQLLKNAEGQNSGGAPPDTGGRIGLEVAARKEDGQFVVHQVLPGSPAAAAGISAGDVILVIDGHSAGNLTAAQVVAHVRGVPGTALDITLQRGDAAPSDYHLVRADASGFGASPASTTTAPKVSDSLSVPAIVSDVDTPAEHAAPHADDFALVIGIEDYESVPKADYGLRDAKAVRKHLEALGWPARNIVSLDGSGATKSKLQSYLQEWLPLNVNDNSTLFVYYSGHGAPDPKTGNAYLVPWDGDPKFLKSTAYPLKQLYSELASLKAKRVLVVLDACFSGAGGRSVLAKGARPLVVTIADALPKAANLTVIAAAGGDEITGTLDEQGHGVFTYYLLKGLSGAAKDAHGDVTAKGLFDYLKPRVEDEARRQNREQIPTFNGSAAGAPLTTY